MHSIQIRAGKMIKIKDGEVRPEGCICELNFGYNAKTVVYANSSLDIPKLSEIRQIRLGSFKKEVKRWV